MQNFKYQAQPQTQAQTQTQTQLSCVFNFFKTYFFNCLRKRALRKTS